VGDNDVRHRVVFSGYYAPTWGAGSSGLAKALLDGWALSWIASAQSGLPYAERVANDLNNDGNRNNDIVPGSRNTHRLPWSRTIDARLARRIPVGRQVKLELIAEAFNLLNSTNISARQATLYNYTGTLLVPQLNLSNPRANFGADTSTQVNFEDTQRIVQLAAKVTF
jgi:hypothetical protein